MKKRQTPRINIYNLAKYKIDDTKLVRQLLRYILNVENYKELMTLNIIITDGKYLKELNKKFFKKNKTTNVISFNLDSLGEIYISRDEIEDPIDFYYYIAHGLLHLIGYTDDTERLARLMDRKCRAYLKKFFIL